MTNARGEITVLIVVIMLLVGSVIFVLNQ